MVWVIQVCWQLANRIRTELVWLCRTKPVPSWFCRIKPVPSWSCKQAVSKPVWHKLLPCVQWKTPDDGQRNCPKHVELYSKYKFEKLVHLVGFTIRIYHNARSLERQIRVALSSCTPEGSVDNQRRVGAFIWCNWRMFNNMRKQGTDNLRKRHSLSSWVLTSTGHQLCLRARTEAAL